MFYFNSQMTLFEPSTVYWNIPEVLLMAKFQPTWGEVTYITSLHDDVIKWKYFPRYWPFVRGIHRSPVNSPHKGQWRGALMFSLISAWINGWVNNGEAGDLRRHPAHYDVIVMYRLRPCSGIDRKRARETIRGLLYYWWVRHPYSYSIIRFILG